MTKEITKRKKTEADIIEDLRKQNSKLEIKCAKMEIQLIKEKKRNLKLQEEIERLKKIKLETHEERLKRLKGKN